MGWTCDRQDPSPPDSVSKPREVKKGTGEKRRRFGRARRKKIFGAKLKSENCEFDRQKVVFAAQRV